MSRDGMHLTQEAEADRLDFVRDYSDGNCSCHISPPCGSCTHPGNPRNQDEDDNCWEKDLENMTIQIDTNSLQAKFDARLALLQDFKGKINQFAADIEQMGYALKRLEEITTIFNSMDEEAKSALPPAIASVLMEGPANKLERVIGNDGIIGVKHFYIAVEKR